MLIPVRKKKFVLDKESSSKEKIEELIKKLGEEGSKIPEPEPTLEEERALFQIASSALLLFTAIGTVVLLLGGLWYLTVPAPSGYVTTQDGKIVPLEKLE